ncbi:MAG: hypothetical protein ABIK28_16990, partial [Planctomycetota bacterium]
MNRSEKKKSVMQAGIAVITGCLMISMFLLTLSCVAAQTKEKKSTKKPQEERLAVADTKPKYT